jgi:hypothetical protein
MLADAVAQALSGLRAEVEAWMTSMCTIRARDGEWVTDPATGEAVQTAGAVAYSGKCRIRPATLQAQSRNLGGDERFISDVQVSVPADTAGIAKGMVVTVDSSPDESLIGLVLEIQDFARGDTLTARRMWCLEVS